MKPSTVEVLVWVLLYGGLILIALGLSIARSEAALGWVVVTAGGIAAAAGVVLIVARSRMSDKP